MQKKIEYWNWMVSNLPVFAPISAVGVKWEFLGHREWGFSIDNQVIVYRDGAMTWQMLEKCRNIAILSIDENPRGFADIVHKLKRNRDETRTFDMTWDFLKDLFDIPEKEMPYFPVLLEKRYGEISWHPYAPSLNPVYDDVFTDVPIRLSRLSRGHDMPSRTEVHHLECDCGNRQTAFQQHPAWEYYSSLSEVICCCGKVMKKANN